MGRIDPGEVVTDYLGTGRSGEVVTDYLGAGRSGGGGDGLPWGG